MPGESVFKEAFGSKDQSADNLMAAATVHRDWLIQKDGLCKTSNSTHGTKVFNKCQSVQKNTQPIAHPLKPKESTEKLVEIPIFTLKIKKN